MSSARLCKGLRADEKAYYLRLEHSYMLPKNGNKGLLLAREENFLYSILDEKRDSEESIVGLVRVAYAHMMYANYSLLIKKDESETLESLSKVNAYVAVALLLSTQTC